MRLLLDTHILIWTLTDPARLQAWALTIVAEAKNTILFSAASIWEIAIKSSLGKRGFEYEPKLIVDAARAASFLEIPVTTTTALIAGSLPRIHRDPFDRMLVAQAIDETASLVTADQVLSGYSDFVAII